ncbi:hypothetical protein BJX68DRAFT_248491 [Aspergillus pseudodeflectus]|uniref:Transmembrane protein n=1 Tax=Aspergillus pseudodeflectus TaxID=176178 RepID=A0ABR4JFP8_9EURO
MSYENEIDNNTRCILMHCHCLCLTVSVGLLFPRAKFVHLCSFGSSWLDPCFLFPFPVAVLLPLLLITIARPAISHPTAHPY